MFRFGIFDRRKLAEHGSRATFLEPSRMSVFSVEIPQKYVSSSMCIYLENALATMSAEVTGVLCEGAR